MLNDLSLSKDARCCASESDTKAKTPTPYFANHCSSVISVRKPSKYQDHNFYSVCQALSEKLTKVSLEWFYEIKIKRSEEQRAMVIQRSIIVLDLD
jgi:hypothetical protein